MFMALKWRKSGGKVQQTAAGAIGHQITMWLARSFQMR
jgi:hypothetical protein